VRLVDTVMPFRLAGSWRLRAATLSLAALFASVLPTLSWADDGLILRRSVVRHGDSLTVYGGCHRPIYLVRESLQRHHTRFVRRPPRGRPYIAVGRTGCTGKHHYVGDFPHGDWSSWSGYLRFRIPRVRPGRYSLVVYCAPCRRGPGGSLIVNNYLWRGDRRVGATALTIKR
jgi:hypothetical protein